MVSRCFIYHDADASGVDSEICMVLTRYGRHCFYTLCFKVSAATLLSRLRLALGISWKQDRGLYQGSAQILESEQ